MQRFKNCVYGDFQINLGFPPSSFLQMSSDAESPHRRSSSDHHRRPHCFPVGSIVEVGSDEKSSRVVYVPATVIPPSSPGKESDELLYVEYDTLLVDDQGPVRLREHVDVSFVRPTPPSLQQVKGFEPDDVVDALYEDGWWTGVVSRVVEGGETVVVTFQNPTEELELGLADVRAHWDWVDGIWVKKESLRFTMSMFGMGKIVEISLDNECYRDAWIPARIEQDLGNGVLSVEYYLGEDVRDEVGSHHVRPWPPKTLFLSKKVDAFFDFAWWSGMISKVLDNGRYVVFVNQLKQDKEFDLWDLRPRMEWKDGKWFLETFSDEGIQDQSVFLSKRRQGPSDSGTPMKMLKEGNGLVQAQGSIEGETMQVNEPQSLLPCVQKKIGVELPSELQSLLDVKTTNINTISVRETIESMQVFQSIPQKPHFQPLEHLKESLREGLALGYMVAFASLVEKSCRLQFDDPKEIIDEIVESFAELEGHGFDVSIVQDRLAKLLALKVKQEKLVVEMKNYKDHITEQNHEKTRIEEEIRQINEQMRKLQEKRLLMQSTKEKVDDEIASLQARLKEAEEGVKSMHALLIA